ncbi:IPT/TIG domain-containing protein [Bradyrhizobium sp. SSUT112]|uniref:IPT/TIG domain-containing protein n=1 Tax=Bradyrhizobium sp. SSUT112 TaxID=3040604 RepID=UPI00244B1864|nr:IPT/TIG domain-containing protein [Bradyrhizobium sp. SSUT112]MDH2352294.1 IPT/TIG domain-containing protein [Bradyrhizobium sp. SSUT112]
MLSILLEFGVDLHVWRACASSRWWCRMQSFAVVRRIPASYVPGSLLVAPALAPSTPKRNKTVLEAIAVLVAAVVIWFAGCAAGRADSAQYYYDPAGRLTVVVDPANGSAQYNYDAVGNILSVVRKPITDLVVAQASPSRGRAGDVVTIFGTGFGSLANTTVSFNGVAASPSAVSATQITVAVPSGATTGPVSVTSPAGSASLVANFAVPILGLPTISGVSPNLVDSGGTITIAGSGFDPVVANNKILVNGRYLGVVSATTSTLTAVVPTVSPGKVSVNTSEGIATSSDYLVVPPTPYVVGSVGAVVNSSVGSSPTVTIASAGKIGLVLFEATAGQHLAMQVTASSIGGGAVQLYGPDGAPIGSSSGLWNGAFIETKVLPRAGTYALLIAPDSTATGSVTINLIDAPDVIGAIEANGTPVSLTTTSPGQNMVLKFNGTAGQRVSLEGQAISGSLTSTCSDFSVLGPNGATIYSAAGCPSNLFSDLITLPIAGGYIIRLDVGSTATGTEKFTLYDAAPDATGTITADGPSVSLTTTTVGQNMSLTFAGTANDRVTLSLSMSSGLMPGYSGLTIVQPDGKTQLYSRYPANYATVFIDLLVLPVTGTYTILFNPNSTTMGTVTFALASVPPDVSGTATIGGGTVALTTTKAGQNMSLTFAGTANQRVSLLFTVSSGLSPGYSPLTILQPNGTTQLYSRNPANYDSLFTDVLVLPVTGTYTILFDPNSTTFGTATFTLTPVPPDVVGTATIGGSAVSLTTTTAGQNMSLTFSGVANQRISLLLSVDNGLSPGYSPLTILQPDGTTQLYSRNPANYASFFTDVLVLPASGTYTIQFNPNGTTTGTATFTLYAEPPDASATITPGGGTVSLTTTVPGQNMGMTFSGMANQRVSLLMTLTNGLVPGCSPLSIIQPNGTTQLFFNGCANYASFFTDVLVLPVTGTYAIMLNPNGMGIGTGTFTLYDVPPDAIGTTSIGQAAVSYDVTAPGQSIQVTFAGTASQSASVNVSRVSSTPSGACYNITTKKPDGSTLRGDGTCNNGYSSGSLTLPTAGTYTVVVDPQATSIGTFSVGVGAP